MNTCFLIPCYNEEKSICNLFESFHSLWKQENSRIIFIDDGSTDSTKSQIEKCANQKRINAEILVLSRNFGKEKAIQAGISIVSPDQGIVLIDADGQHTPKAAADLLAELKRTDVDIAFGVRKNRNYQSFFSRNASKTIYKLLNFCKKRYHISPRRGDFFACKPNVTRALKKYSSVRPFWKGYYGYMGFKSKDIEVTIPCRPTGCSKFNLWSLSELAIDGLTSYTTWILRGFFLLGVIIGTIALLAATCMIAEYILTGATASGFYSLVLLIMFFGSANLIALSVVGEFLKSTIVKNSGLPSFIIQEHLSINDAQDYEKRTY